jgi:hypothetical protein
MVRFRRKYLSVQTAITGQHSTAVHKGVSHRLMLAALKVRRLCTNSRTLKEPRMRYSCSCIMLLKFAFAGFAGGQLWRLWSRISNSRPFHQRLGRRK